MKDVDGIMIPETLEEQLGRNVSSAIFRATRNGVPADALQVTARWWQLETYLRLVAHIELRAQLGPTWESAFDPRVHRRREDAVARGYMASADDTSVLAHADVYDLFKIIEDNWSLFEGDIGIPLATWLGRVAELRPIRHRIAHCRRPHSDDGDRIEQLLRDLEFAANRALRNYVDFRDPSESLEDPMIDDWIRLAHADAQRLVPHGASNKGIHFGLQVSVRAWADLSSGRQFTGTPGVFWVLRVVLEDRHLFIDDYWSEGGVQHALDRICHIIQPSDMLLYVTFPAVGDSAQIAEAIGLCFEAVFQSSRPGFGKGSVRHPWRRPMGADLDPRVDAEGLLSVLSGLNEEDPISYFAAEK